MKNFEILTKTTTATDKHTKETRITIGEWYRIPQNFKKFFETANVGDYSINGMDFSFTREVRNTGSRNADGTPRKSEFLRFSIDGKADCSITDAYKRLGLNATPEQVLRGAIAAFGISLNEEQEKQVAEVTAELDEKQKAEKKKAETKAEAQERANIAEERAKEIEETNKFLFYLATAGKADIIAKGPESEEYRTAFQTWITEQE